MAYNPITAAMQLDPRVARLLNGGMVPSLTPAPRGEPTVAGEPDTRTVEQVCDDILKLAKEVRKP